MALRNHRDKNPLERLYRAATRRVLLWKLMNEIRRSPRWGQVQENQENQGYFRVLWRNERGHMSGGEDHIAEVDTTNGLRVWRNEYAELHRMTGPTMLDLWGSTAWFCHSAEADIDLLDKAWKNGNLTDKQAYALFEEAARTPKQTDADMDVTPFQWMCRVIEKHRSPRLSDEVRAYAALVTMSREASV